MNSGYTYIMAAEIVEFVYGMEADYAESVHVRRFGKSYEGRDLLEVRISSDLCHQKPAIWLEFTAHAREWISPSTGLNLIHTLASGTQDGESMLVKYDWYIVPVLNPDGYEYSFDHALTEFGIKAAEGVAMLIHTLQHTDQRFWRKNRQRTGRDCVGIDLNRNWDINFGGRGSSGNCTSPIYRGKKAFSAPETKALKKAIKRTSNVIAFFSIHSFGQVIAYPYGYTDTPTPDHDELMAVGVSIADALYALRGTEYVVAQGSDFYPVSGAVDDYWYSEGIKYSYTFELPPMTVQQGHFILPTSEIYPVAIEIIAGLKAFSELELDI